jgi:hypothetical protein
VSRSGGGWSYRVILTSNGIFVIPSMASRGIHESEVTDSSTRMLWDTTVNPLFQTRCYLWSLPRAAAQIRAHPGSQLGSHLHSRRLGLDHDARAPRHLTRPAAAARGSSARVVGETITK